MILPIHGYSNQNFTAKKFRLPINGITYSVDGSPIFTDSFKGYREYSNPNAEELYKKAKETTDISEKLKFLAEMGDYKIINLEIENKISKFIKQIL